MKLAKPARNSILSLELSCDMTFSVIVSRSTFTTVNQLLPVYFTVQEESPNIPPVRSAFRLAVHK